MQDAIVSLIELMGDVDLDDVSMDEDEEVCSF